MTSVAMGNFSQHVFNPPPDMHAISPTYSQSSNPSNNQSYETFSGSGSQRNQVEGKSLRKASSQYLGGLFKRNSVDKQARSDAQFLAGGSQTPQAHPQAVQSQSRGRTASQSNQSTQGQSQAKDEKPAPKRRGPKPDSKPALNRRQELNRQAQRTHRERKELYAKSLENNNIQLKEQLSSISKQRDAVASENSILKELLRVNGIPYHASPSTVDVIGQENGFTYGGDTVNNGSFDGSAVNFADAPSSTRTMAGQISNLPNVSANHNDGSFTASSNALPADVSPAMTAMSLNPQNSTNASLNGGHTAKQSPVVDRMFPLVRNNTNGSGLTGSTMYSDGGSINYLPTTSNMAYGQSVANQYSSSALDQSIPDLDLQNSNQREIMNPQVNINAGFSGHPPVFGKPGIDHIRWGNQLIIDLESSCRDHAKLMMQRGAAPGSTELSGHAMMITCPPHSLIMDSLNNAEIVFPHQLPGMPQHDLNVMLSNAAENDMGGGVTPVQALIMIRNDTRYPTFNQADLDFLKTILQQKSRCYGFGAILEEYEVRDALDAIEDTKTAANKSFQSSEPSTMPMDHTASSQAMSRPSIERYRGYQTSTAQENVGSLCYMPNGLPSSNSATPIHQTFAKRTSSLTNRFGPMQAVAGANATNNPNGQYPDQMFSTGYV